MCMYMSRGSGPIFVCLVWCYVYVYSVIYVYVYVYSLPAKSSQLAGVCVFVSCTVIRTCICIYIHRSILLGLEPHGTCACVFVHIISFLYIYPSCTGGGQGGEEGWRLASSPSPWTIMPLLDIYCSYLTILTPRS